MTELSNFSKAIRDPIWKHIWMSGELYAITKEKPFMRLYNIKQLGPAELVYPGASHTRASHSIGVYNTALKMLNILLKKGADAWVSKQGAMSFLTAALLHDLGHFPFTHSLKELKLKEHEDLTGELILKEPMRSAAAKTGADPEQTAAIISGKGKKDAETVFFQKLLSGVLDPDKLDYLNRDAFYCGVPYGIQDTDFILSQLLPDKKNGIKIESKAILSVESILFSKYLMYKSVYWHKDVRIATAMMKKAIFAGMEKEKFCPEALYHQDDEGIFRLLEKSTYPEKKPAEDLRIGKIYRIIAEEDFKAENPKHQDLEDLHKRREAEEILAEYFSAKTGMNIGHEEIIIDIPERISFESDLFIEDEKKVFTESSTVFSKEFIKTLVPSLRKIRVAVSDKIHKKVINLPQTILPIF
ncbi:MULTISPECIES: HD domain-containing protein [unclassified Treponema]|uniref:HD domain-containing protein n=1 Tax=unclassified Treponema TaxID=2638727 RepID=UPI0020A47396|nr:MULTISPECIES: HD domain-containing protein [unclassified Treponema]UTC68242.1 HD domain-containing protein [Treponema sp. OMZ 789]UTC70962.1 HD domain-containing protein [Treponema sp. OMZ 790]UTC73702.1 HD domain-containing protein [Treponema sp. OMZ 791]